LFIYTIVYAS